MATKSFLKDINVNSRKKAQQLINALDKAEKVRGQDVTFQRSVNEVSRADVKDFAPKIKWAG